MGANAQTSVPDFTAGQVLTAAQMTEVNTGIPVFADSSARDAAFGGTGEKTLAEGQFAFLEDTNATQFYDGANWLPVGTTPGFVTIVAETSFTSVSSVTENDIYTSDFNNYEIIVQFQSSNGGALLFRNRVGGVSAATNYNFQELSANGTSVTAARSSSATSYSAGDANGAFLSASVIRLVSPNLATPTNIYAESAYSVAAYTTPINNLRFGNHSTATAYDGFELIAPAGGTMTGTYTVWGLAK